MRIAARFLLALILAVSTLSCQEDDKVDAGGVTINLGQTVIRLDTVGVTQASAVGEVAWPRLDLVSVVVHPGGSSDQMNILFSSYEVTFSRADGGTRLPPPLVRFFTASLPAAGTLTINGLPILGPDQLETVPLSNLQIENGGLDRETNQPFTRLNVNMRFFGRTLGGRDVASPNITFTIEFVP